MVGKEVFHTALEIKEEREKKRADAILRRVWSNRKRKEIRDILSHPNPPTNKRLYFGGFLRYGVGLVVDEIVEICDVYAGWKDYDRGITSYYLRHIGKEGKAQREIRTFHREEEQSDDSRFFSPLNFPEGAKRVIEIPDGAGIVMTWIRIEGELG